MDDHHLNYVKNLERKKEKHWSKGIPPLPPPPHPKLKNICHISFFQSFSFFNPCFNFMNCDVKRRKLVKITLKKKKNLEFSQKF